LRRAFFARHGESLFSARSLLNGDTSVDVGLTATGLEQARRLAVELRDLPIDLCVTSEFQRVRETADEALRGRDVPRLVVRELNDPLYGRFEGATIEEYRRWAVAAPSSEAPAGGGESRHAIVRRYARGFALVLARPEETILVVGHSLPISYLLGALEGRAPGPRAPLAEYARLYEVSAPELERAHALLEEWLGTPTW
jgi:broad specificity phosphatase PhoE